MWVSELRTPGQIGSPDLVLVSLKLFDVWLAAEFLVRMPSAGRA